MLSEIKVGDVVKCAKKLIIKNRFATRSVWVTVQSVTVEPHAGSANYVRISGQTEDGTVISDGGKYFRKMAVRA